MRALALALLTTAACTSVPTPAGPPRTSGHSALMDQTSAGRVTCDSTDHLRPFVIEWDATDLSSFEARAATDMVFVRYDKCRLEVLDECTQDSLRGALGAYGAVTWTAGVLEKVDIRSEAELVAKLPLGVATLGGRVAGGEAFHMEYFVAGTRKATRAAVYRGDLEGVVGCRGATHFVYAYNLGAFVLGSLTHANAEAGATLWGIGGASVGAQHESAVEKRGGQLESCRGDSARETERCKAPIRLTLRGIEDGANPDKVAAAAPETPDALNLAGKLQAQGERSSERGERMALATQKLSAGDGVGCLRELDAADQLATKSTELSTEPQSYVAMTRARCLMEADQCAAGKTLWRRAQEATQPGTAPAQLDTTVDAMVGMHCKGKALEPRDRLIRGLTVLQDGSYQARLTPAACQAAFDGALAVLPAVTPRGPEDSRVVSARRQLLDSGPRCLARAGACASAWKALGKVAPLVNAHEKHSAFTGKSLVSYFVGVTRGECLGKPVAALPPAEQVWRVTEELGLSAPEIEWTPAACQARYDAVRPVMGKLEALSPNDQRSTLGGLAENLTKCFDRVGRCAEAYRANAEVQRLAEPDRHPYSIADSFDRWRARGCWLSRIDGLSGDDQVYWDVELLDRQRTQDKPDGALCRALVAELAPLWRPEHTDTAKNDLRAKAMDSAATCLGKAGLCADGRQAHIDSLRRRSSRRSAADDAASAARWAEKFGCPIAAER